MDQSDQELDRLSALLHALPVENMPMTLSELDGYLGLCCTKPLMSEVPLSPDGFSPRPL
ncbi:hypothetical protein QKW60_04545 [Defluviimonas aestuarii]|nr:hypothetical protein [Defluviimonas aestuarii]